MVYDPSHADSMKVNFITKLRIKDINFWFKDFMNNIIHNFLMDSSPYIYIFIKLRIYDLDRRDIDQISSDQYI